MPDFSTNTNVNTSTLESLVGATVDTILTYSPATLFFLGNQKPWKGSQMRFPIKYAKNSQGMWFTGLEKFSTTQSTNFANMTFNPTGREINSVISQIEVDINETNKVIDLIGRRLASDAQDMASDIASAFYTAQTGNAFLSLIDAADDSTLTTATYGGLNRDTYGLNGNYTASVGNLTLATMATSYNNATHGPNSPNLLLCDKTTWSYYEKLLTPTVQHNVNPLTLTGYPQFTGASQNGLPNIVAPGTNLKGTQGFNALYYKGKPMIADESAPSGYLFMLNTKDIAFYGVKTTDPDYKTVQFTGGGLESVYSIPVTTGFSFSGFNKPIDQYGKVGHILLVGNLINRSPRNQSLLTGITGA